MAEPQRVGSLKFFFIGIVCWNLAVSIDSTALSVALPVSRNIPLTQYTHSNLSLDNLTTTQRHKYRSFLVRYCIYIMLSCIPTNIRLLLRRLRAKAHATNSSDTVHRRLRHMWRSSSHHRSSCRQVRARRRWRRATNDDICPDDGLAFTTRTTQSYHRFKLDMACWNCGRSDHVGRFH